jgi:hypothetical protein
VRARIDQADAQRLAAVTAMFARYAYTAEEADIRARILYFMQIGYHALDLREPRDTRIARTAAYLKGFTGVDPAPAETAEFLSFARDRMPE